MKSRHELEEIIAKAICDSHPLRANKWDDIVSLSQCDGYMVAKGIVENTRVQANAVLDALLSSLPDNSKEIETQARNMQLECFRNNPTASISPSIAHYEQQLSYLDKSGEYYKELLEMKK